MAAEKLEARVAALEADVAHLKEELAKSKKDDLPWWEKIAGTFANDPIYAEAMRLGRKYRESTRPRPRKKKKAHHGGS